MKQEKNNICKQSLEIPAEMRQLLIDCDSENQEISIPAMKKLAELLEEPLIYNITKEFSEEWYSKEDIIKTVFPLILISGNDERK